MWCSALWNVDSLPFMYKPSFLTSKHSGTDRWQACLKKSFLILSKNISINRKGWRCYQSLWAQLLISSALLMLPLAQRFHFLCLYGIHQDCFDRKAQRHMAESFLLFKPAFTGSPVHRSSSNDNQRAGKIIQRVLSSDSELIKKKANSSEWTYFILKIKRK